MRRIQWNIRVISEVLNFPKLAVFFFGKVQGIRSPYEGSTASDLVDDFHGTMDDYMALCESEREQPEIAYKGILNVRLGPKLHRNAAIYAITRQQSLNSFIKSAVLEKLNRQHT